MAGDLAIELIAENNHVFKLVGQGALIEAAVVPDLRFLQEVEACSLHQLRLAGHGIRPEEQCGAEDPFEAADEALVFLAALLHPERVQHFGATLEANGLALLLNSQSRQVDRDQTVLAIGHAVVGMTGDLQDEVAVSPFI